MLHEHHLIIRVGAGLIQFVYGSHSRPRQKSIFAAIFAGSFIATISFMGWLRSNLHIAQIGRNLTHSLSVSLFLLLLFTNTLTHFNSVHLQLTCNQQEKMLESTSLLSVLPSTHSTLVPNPFDKDLDTLTLNESNTKHIRKGHQRLGHPQLATHTTTR